MAYEIKKNVPYIKGAKYPFADMMVGDMFEIEREKMSTIRSYATNFWRKYSMVFSIRKIDDNTFGCWRVR